MINLNITNVSNLKSSYLEYMNERVLNEVILMQDDYINPFTGRAVKLDVNNNGDNTEEFIEDILTEEIEKICIKYPSFDNYFKTCQFYYYGKFKITNELLKIKEKNCKENKENFRKQYFEKFNNPWLENIVGNYSEFYRSNNEFDRLRKDVEAKLKVLNSYLARVFNYNFIEANERHSLLFNLNIEVCPYCNRNFISKYEKNGNLKTTADLDHFYPKSVFQFLSLSLHNFVPACQICNSRFKLDKGIEIINPYTEKIDYNQFKFKHNLNSYSKLSIFFDENNDFDIKIECQNNKYLNNIELFELEKLYNTHKSLVAEIVYKKEAYNNSYQELFNNLFDEINLSENEKQTFLYGIEMDETKFHKKPLAKLIFDIVNYN